MAVQRICILKNLVSERVIDCHSSDKSMLHYNQLALTFQRILYYNSFFNTIPISISPYSSLVSILNNDLSSIFSLIKRLNPVLYTEHSQYPHQLLYINVFNTKYRVTCMFGAIQDRYVYLLSPADIHPRHQNTAQGPPLPSQVYGQHQCRLSCPGYTLIY